MYNKKESQYDGYIYLIENKINGKQYIGQTLRSIDVRFKEHIRHSYTYKNNKRTKNKILYKAINKYGVDNFICKELLQCHASSIESLKDILNTKEIELISKYDTLVPNGYNMTIGGNFDGCIGNNRRPIAQYDLAGNLVSVYCSISDAYQKTNFTSLFSALGKDYLIGGYQWIYIDDINNVNTKILPYDGKCTKRIIQTDFQGSIIAEYLSIGEASKKTGINNVSIGDCVNNRNGRKSAGGYQWFYVDFDEDINKIKFPKYIPNSNRNNMGIHNHPINMYSSNNEYIKTFSTTIEALSYIRKEKCNSSSITSCCAKRQKTAFGYKWFYIDDPTQPDKTKIIQEVS